MSRAVPEWRGKTDDTRPPPTVRARVFLAHGGACHLSGRKIGPADKWDLDHVKALCNGGLNIERPTSLPPCATSTARRPAADVGERSKTDRIRAKHLGIHPASEGEDPLARLLSLPVPSPLMQMLRRGGDEPPMDLRRGPLPAAPTTTL